MRILGWTFLLILLFSGCIVQKKDQNLAALMKKTKRIALDTQEWAWTEDTPGGLGEQSLKLFEYGGGFKYLYPNKILGRGDSLVTENGIFYFLPGKVENPCKERFTPDVFRKPVLIYVHGVNKDHGNEACYSISGPKNTDLGFGYNKNTSPP